MARLDKVKNLTGLAEWYAGNQRLRGLVNLVIVGESRAAAWQPLVSFPGVHVPSLLCILRRRHVVSACTQRAACHVPTTAHRALLPSSSGGVIDPAATMDREEAAECEHMHELVEKYKMHGTFRWIVAQASGCMCSFGATPSLFAGCVAAPVP